MSKPELPAELPEDLSSAVALTSIEEVGATWDMGIAGMGFMLSSLDQESPFEFRSYEVQSVPIQKPRLDDSDEPGEQTLAEWWARAQHSWHLGAGQNVFDSPSSNRFKFTSSKGINIWEEGELSLLKDTAELVSGSIDDYHLISTDVALIYTHNGEIEKDPDPDASSESGEASEATHSGTPINSLAYDGESVYAAFSGGSLGIKKIDVAAFASWSDVNAQTAVDEIAFVKGRLMGAKGNQLFEYDLSVTTEPEPFYTDEASTWVFTSITETGPAIYFAGYAGDRSEILAARLTAQDIPFASVATVGAPRNVWTAPEGETVHSIKGYIGQAVLIGTSRGVRIGTIVTDEGDLSVSALIVETDYPVRNFEPQEEFAWFGWSRYDGTSSGLGRVHLGTQAYASDLMFTGVGDVMEVVRYGDRMYFVLDEGSTARVIKEHATQLTASGSLLNKEIRFGTTERKTVRYFDILTGITGKWSLDMGVNGNALAPRATDNEAGGYHEEVLTLEGTRFDVSLTLTRDDGDATLGPKVFEWRLRSEPRTTGRFRYLVPVMCYDFILNKVGTEVGKVGQALAMLTHLTDLYRSDSDIAFQPLSARVPGGVDSLTVKLEELRFKTYTPPSGGRGFGGIVLLVLREIR